MLNQVTATAEAVALIEKLKAANGPLIFHQSGGCCDGSAPMCYPKDEMYLDDSSGRYIEEDLLLLKQREETIY